MIDPHVHLRDGSQAAKETIAHGLAVAYECGFRSVFDMPNTEPALTTVPRIKKRLAFGTKEAQKRGMFYGVYAGVSSDTSQLLSIIELHKSQRQLVGLKMFGGHSTGNMGLVNPQDQQRVYEILAENSYKGVLCVHCEKGELLRPDLKPQSHFLSRPAQAEVASVADQIAFAQKASFGGVLHIAHISTAKALALVVAAKQEGMNIVCGATAHHALLDQKSGEREDNLLKMNPPLRSASDRQAIYEGLLHGSIDWIESDHAPHSPQDKAQGASGIPGFGGTLLLINALLKSGIEPKRLYELLGGKVNAIHQLDLPVLVPSHSELKEKIAFARKAYWYDPFSSLEV
ncbi:MAG: dihydroorotase [Sphaerochaetaceae bacterium]